MQALSLSALAFVAVVAVALVSLFLEDGLLQIGVAISAAAQACGTGWLMVSGHTFYLVVLTSSR